MVQGGLRTYELECTYVSHRRLFPFRARQCITYQRLLLRSTGTCAPTYETRTVLTIIHTTVPVRTVQEFPDDDERRFAVCNIRCLCCHGCVTATVWGRRGSSSSCAVCSGTAGGGHLGEAERQRDRETERQRKREDSLVLLEKRL
jgi:hypothetical protein